MTGVQNVVLVHGGFVDGSGWRGVYDVLTADGFNVSVVQNQTLSLDERRRNHHERARRTGRSGDPRRPLLRRRGDHRGRHPRQRLPGWSTSPRSRRTPASRSTR